ncbi:hypothetical protein AAC387_Pa01g0575 [Persea americana]
MRDGREKRHSPSELEAAATQLLVTQVRRTSYLSLSLMCMKLDSSKFTRASSKFTLVFFKIQCEIDVGEASREEADVCGRFFESKSMGIDGLSSAISDSSGEEEHEPGWVSFNFPG